MSNHIYMSIRLLNELWQKHKNLWSFLWVVWWLVFVVWSFRSLVHQLSRRPRRDMNTGCRCWICFCLLLCLPPTTSSSCCIHVYSSLVHQENAFLAYRPVGRKLLAWRGVRQCNRSRRSRCLSTILWKSSSPKLTVQLTSDLNAASLWRGLLILAE